MNAARRPAVLLLIGFAAFALMGIPAGILNIVWVRVQDTFALPLEALGLLLGAITLGRLISTFSSGSLIARFGLGRQVLVGSLLSALGLGLYALAPAWPVVLSGGLLFGLGSGLIDAGINTFVAAHYSASRLNWLHASYGLGLTIGPMLATAIVLDMGQSWQISYAAVVLIQLLLTLLLVVTLPHWRIAGSDPASVPDTAVHQAPPQATLRLGVVWLVLALVFIYGGAEVGFGQLSNSLFVDGRGVDPKTAAGWISLYWAGFTVGRLVIGPLADLIGTRTLLRLSMAGAVLGALAVALNLGPTANFAALAFAGLSLAPVFPSLIAEMPKRVGLAHVANVIGFQIGAGGLGGTVLPALAGALAGRLGLETIALFFVAVTVLTLILHEFLILRSRVTVAVAS